MDGVGGAASEINEQRTATRVVLAWTACADTRTCTRMWATAAAASRVRTWLVRSTASLRSKTSSFKSVLMSLTSRRPMSSRGSAERVITGDKTSDGAPFLGEKSFLVSSIAKWPEQ